MNCFETRKEFISFWRRTMSADERARFNAHLRHCSRCDRSFRVFALTAPALHSESASEQDAASYPAGTPQRRQSAVRDAARRETAAELPWRAMTAAFAMAVAAAIAVYVAIPARVTFEQALAVEAPTIEPVSYAAADNVFGQEVFGQELGLQESIYNGTAANESVAE